MKKLFFGSITAVIVSTGIFTFAGCEKEETITYDITKCAQNYWSEDNSSKPKPEKFYQLTMCLTADNLNGIRCENVPWVPTAFRCSEPHKCRALENKGDQYPDGNKRNASAIHFQSKLDMLVSEYGNFTYCKSFIDQYRDLLYYLYEIQELDQNPDELYTNAPEYSESIYYTIEE